MKMLYIKKGGQYRTVTEQKFKSKFKKLGFEVVKEINDVQETKNVNADQQDDPSTPEDESDKKGKSLEDDEVEVPEEDKVAFNMYMAMKSAELKALITQRELALPEDQKKKNLSLMLVADDKAKIQ